eukprot:TRINITY_DN156_c0_g1_i2.p1 TRINITY_DN156_c0_g1~~TRINITY_DN156_c0_g1_i2.p1  ORF type:complete len:306 (-),score=74.50 TRINITY_DN156_c0_g1_i2:82-999(-)
MGCCDCLSICVNCCLYSVLFFGYLILFNFFVLKQDSNYEAIKLVLPPRNISFSFDKTINNTNVIELRDMIHIGSNSNYSYINKKEKEFISLDLQISDDMRLSWKTNTSFNFTMIIGDGVDHYSLESSLFYTYRVKWISSFYKTFFSMKYTDEFYEIPAYINYLPRQQISNYGEFENNATFSTCGYLYQKAPYLLRLYEQNSFIMIPRGKIFLNEFLKVENCSFHLFSAKRICMFEETKTLLTKFLNFNEIKPINLPNDQNPKLFIFEDIIGEKTAFVCADDINSQNCIDFCIYMAKNLPKEDLFV